MKILARFRQFGKLKPLREAARRTPSPTTLGALAERLISMGRIDEAHQTARRGLLQFPRSSRLNAACTFATKHGMQSRIARLRKEMEDVPNPSVFSEMAEIYRDLGDDDKVIEICEQCIERFPLNEKPYMISGAVRLDRFIEDMAAHEGFEAEMQLRRVVKLNAENVEAHLLLGKLYFIVGAHDTMEHHVREVIHLAPRTPGLEEFLNDIPTRVTDDGDQDNVDIPIRERIRSVEFQSEFPFPPHAFPATSGTADLPGTARLDMENMEESLAEIGQSQGVMQVLILDRNGLPLTDAVGADTLTGGAFADLMTDILQTAQTASRKMDVGRFSNCTIEGPFGGIFIGAVKNIRIGLKYDLTVRTERALELMEDFTAGSFTTLGEVTA
ncbi:MAG: roadblock/LC7 domain-containing protein [Actinobacteria bacterium]|nr:roadblock/LC7 domain-containing protein [Actinomycetota bacterium]